MDLDLNKIIPQYFDRPLELPKKIYRLKYSFNTNEQTSGFVSNNGEVNPFNKEKEEKHVEYLIKSRKISLKKIIQFQSEHNVDLRRLDNYMNVCFIDEKAYSSGITPMFSICTSIIDFNEINSEG